MISAVTGTNPPVRTLQGASVRPNQASSAAVIGQAERWVLRAGVFLLLGPTGTRKTKTVEAIAQLLHGSERTAPQPKILIVDDNRDLLLFFAAELEQEGDPLQAIFGRCCFELDSRSVSSGAGSRV